MVYGISWWTTAHLLSAGKLLALYSIQSNHSDILSFLLFLLGEQASARLILMACTSAVSSGPMHFVPVGQGKSV